jgi:hypothetical protein
MESDFAKYTEDFSNKTYTAWEGYNIVCPKLDDPISIKGTQQTMDNNVMIFAINKCSDDTRSPEMIARGDKCKS